jgi:L-serine dehydratase
MPVTTQTLAHTSAFEILGPVMVGPSSSHTAGALRLSRLAASLLQGRVVRVRFRLWNSFAHTYRGHGSDRALVAGILGLDADDERIRDAFDLARDAGLDYGFEVAGDDATLHPNTVDIDMTDDTGAQMLVRGESLGGAAVRISRINGIGVEMGGVYATLFVTHRDVPGVIASIAQLLADDDINIAFCRTYRTERGGEAYSFFEIDGLADPDVLPRLLALRTVTYATFVKVPGEGSQLPPGRTAEELFDNGAQMVEACHDLGCSVGELMEQREWRLGGRERADAQMARVLEVMRQETTSPIRDPQPSLGGFLGGEARMVADGSAALSGKLMGPVQTDAVARAMAVLERSATMGVIVAAPTAGSSGVVPGCVLALADAMGAEDAQVMHALWAASAIGLNIQTSATVAGAEGGCQAEVGTASAMAASALVELMGGTPEQEADAAALAISNLLGLVCDPVGGLVEVPCQTRNAIGVAAAFSSAQLVLSGVRSLVPFDEVVVAMGEVGHALPASLRETARGGLATTPTACAACEGCAGL